MTVDALDDEELAVAPQLQLDRGTESTFEQFFGALPEAENTLRLFERDAYYTVHGDDARFVADTVFRTATVLKYFAGGLPYVNLTRLAMQSLVSDLLLVKQMRVELWSGGRSNGGAWTCGKKGSPGNVQAFEDLLYGGADGEGSSGNANAAPRVAALRVHQRKDQDRIIGLAFADASRRTLGVCETIDNALFTNLDALLVQLSIKECLVCDDDLDAYDAQKLRSVLDRCDVVVTRQRRADFASEDVVRDLGRLLGESATIAGRAEVELTNAMSATAALIRYLSLLSDETNFGQYTLAKHDHGAYMRLDSAAVKALHVMPAAGSEGANKSMSLFGLLNQCRTTQGANLLSQWLKQPLLDVQQIVNRQNMVQMFVDNVEFRQNIKDDHFRNVPDLVRLAKKFQRGKGNLQDVVRFHDVVVKLPRLLGDLLLVKDGAAQAGLSDLLQERYVGPLETYLGDLTKFQELVETTVDLEAVKNHDYRIKPDFDENLQNVRAQLDAVTAEIHPEVNRVTRELGETKVKLDRNNQHGFVFKVSRADGKAIQNKRGYHELSTLKSGVTFTTDALRELSERYAELDAEYNVKQNALVQDVLAIVLTYCPVLELLNALVAELDVLASFAHVSANALVPFVKPTIQPKGTGDLVLIGARHPCLEVQDDVNFIANDVVMRRESGRFLVITGPNMGGKSTYIRQAGVITLLAQTGSFVPCDEAQVPIIDGVYARVGAGDSQLKGVSTFMAEMLETASIMRSATADSLVIVDELGRGTSTYDGFGLAWAISEYIATKVGAFCLFATHFHELTALEKEVPTVKNLHVTAVTTHDSIALLYKVQEGVCDQSFGIHVAELARFPKGVVKLAKRKVAELEQMADQGEMDAALAEQEREALRKVDAYMSKFARLQGLEQMDEETLIGAVEAFHRDASTEFELTGDAYVTEKMGF